MTDFSPRGTNRREMDDYLARARETEGVTESGLWRAAFVNVGGAIAHALLDVADAIRDAAEGGYSKEPDE
jgi:hypothetical protein